MMIALRPYSDVNNVDLDWRNLKEAEGAGEVRSEVRRTTCNVGTMVSRDFTYNAQIPPLYVRRVNIHPVVQSPTQRYMIDIFWATGRESKDITFRTCEDIVSRLRFVDDTTNGAIR